MNKYHELQGVAELAIQKKLEMTDLFLFWGGYAAYYLKDYQKAALFLKESIDLNNTRAQSYEYFAKTMDAVGQNKIASIMQQTAVELNQKYGKPLVDEKIFKIELY